MSNVGRLGFSPDSRHLYYVVHPNPGRDGPQFMECDGVAGPPHEQIRRPFIHNGKLRYWVIDENRMKLVELADWPKHLDWTNGLKPAKP